MKENCRAAISYESMTSPSS